MSKREQMEQAEARVMDAVNAGCLLHKEVSAHIGLDVTRVSRIMSRMGMVRAWITKEELAALLAARAKSNDRN